MVCVLVICFSFFFQSVSVKEVVNETLFGVFVWTLVRFTVEECRGRDPTRETEVIIKLPDKKRS